MKLSELTNEKAAEVIGPTLEEVMAENPPKTKVNKVQLYLRYNFSDKELLDYGRELGRASQEILQLEGELDSMKKQFNARIAAAEAKRQMLAAFCTNGYDMRNVDCEVRLNQPGPKIKTIVRLDTGEVVEVKSMDSYECQEELNFEQDQEKKDGTPEAGSPAPATPPSAG